MEKVIIKGGDIYYADNPSSLYASEEGSLLVYLIPLKDGKEGRKLFLAEMKEGEFFPGFIHSSEYLGEWILGVVALEKAVVTVSEGACTQKDVLEFAKKVDLNIEDAQDFPGELIEKYEKLSVREKGYIYATRREVERTREKSFRLILGLFENGKDKARSEKFVETGKALYDEAAYICSREKISIASLDRIQENCGRRYEIADIARISHFVIREVVLEGKWYKSDCGSFLATRAEDKAVVALVPKGPYSYLMYCPSDGTVVKVTPDIASGLKASAYMFYRPFPEKKIYKRDLFKFGMEKVYKSDIVRLFAMALIGTLVGLLLPFMNEQAYDKFIPMGNSSGLIQLGAVLLACSLGNITFTIVKNLSSFRSMNTMEYAVQSAAIDRLFNLPESFFRNYDAATLGQRVMGISTIYNVIAQSVTTSLLSAVFSLLYLWRMFKYSAKMSGWALVFLVLIDSFVVIMGVLQTKYEGKKLRADVKAQAASYQMITGISKIRIAGAEDRAILNYLGSIIESIRINTKKERITRAVSSVSCSFQIFFSIVFYFLMVRKNIDLTIGGFSAFSAAFGAFSGALLQIVQNMLVVNQVKPLYDDVKPILETLPESSEDALMPGKIEGGIEVNNVTFSYNPNEAPALSNFSLSIKPGEYVGIVGSSGCGKSTLLKILLGFEKHQVGKVYYDNQDIDDLDKRELRKKFGVVLQDGGLITGSIYDNITITSPGVKMQRVEETIREVGLEDDIKQMPMGLHTAIAEGAGTISGGQAQRILIARAIVGKPRVIFLDEATSALDNVTQNQVVETLEGIEATKIVIAHRLSTVKNCDRIIVMDKGSIVEQGSYEQLMEAKGRFYDLAIRQIS